MRIFITHIVPRKDVLRYHLSVAGCNFSWNLIEGKVFDKIYSILPPYVSGSINDFDGLVYSKWRKKNRIFARFATVLEQFMVYKQIPKGSSVWFYNMTSINCILFILLRWFKRNVKANVIVLDYTPYKKKFSFAYWMLFLCNHAHGTICLANSELFSVKNTILLPGVVPVNNQDIVLQKKIKKEFLISGVLREEISMISMLLCAFSKMPNCILHICGFANDDTMIREYSGRYSNIIYHGKVSYEDYMGLLNKTSFLLSTRDIFAPENKCNFPSKVMEGLLYNRIIISTIHYPQLKGIKYFKVSAQAESFVDDIQKIISMSQEKLLDYANQSVLVKRKFNTMTWRNSMATIESKV